MSVWATRYLVSKYKEREGGRSKRCVHPSGLSGKGVSDYVSGKVSVSMGWVELCFLSARTFILFESSLVELF